MQATEPDAKVLDGSCLCGAVKFEVIGDIPELYSCHCSICRKATGAAANAAFCLPPEKFRWLGGDPEIKTWIRETGYRNDFCPQCGSSVPNPLRGGDGFWCPAGLLNGPTGSKIANHYCVASKADFDVIAGDAPQHD